jgi:Holliday junction DNA helicase RuvA
MIISIEGTLVAASPLRAVIELNGLGYEVHIPATTAERLPHLNSKVRLHTVAIYREDAQTLYGFATNPERDFFRLLVEHVTGVGPKVALTIMSRLSLPALEGAIRTGDVALLGRTPGIGRKTAERLVVELKNKLGTGNATTDLASTLRPGGADPADVAPHRDAVSALVALGFKTADADQAIRHANLALGADATTEQLVKKALSG